MSVIDDALKDLPADRRTALQHVREVIKKALPDAEDVISYGMPGFKYKKKYLVTFGNFKDHMSLFPGSSAPVALADKVAPFVVSKGTLQFTVDKPIPDELITEIAHYCAKTIDEK